MSQNVPVASIQSYKGNVELLLQQLRSRFRMCVDVKSDYTGKASKAIEQIGQVAVSKRTVRHGDVTPVNTPHDARWLHPEDWEVADLVDDFDKLRMLYDPTGYYAMNFKAAHERGIDDVIIAAALGTSYTGENGTVAVPLPASQVVLAGGSGLTVAKLKSARRILRAAEVPEDEPMYCAVTAEEEDDLMGEIQVISSDFAGADRPVLKEGKLERFLGFNFVHSERLLLNGSSERRVIAWVKSGLHLGLWKDVYTSVDKIPTKGPTWQVYTCATYAASRTQEKKVVEIACA